MSTTSLCLCESYEFSGTWEFIFLLVGMVDMGREKWMKDNERASEETEFAKTNCQQEEMDTHWNQTYH